MSPFLFQLGAESGVDNPNLRAMKTVFRIMPFVILPLTINFPTVSLSFIRFGLFNLTSHHTERVGARTYILNPLLLRTLSAKILFFSNKHQAVFTYWLTSNCFSLAQVALLRHPLIRDKLRIPERIKHPASALPQNDGFIESMKKGRCLNLCPIGNGFDFHVLFLLIMSVL